MLQCCYLVHRDNSAVFARVTHERKRWVPVKPILPDTPHRHFLSHCSPTTQGWVKERARWGLVYPRASLKKKRCKTPCFWVFCHLYLHHTHTQPLRQQLSLWQDFFLKITSFSILFVSFSTPFLREATKKSWLRMETVKSADWDGYRRIFPNVILCHVLGFWNLKTEKGPFCFLHYSVSCVFWGRERRTPLLLPRWGGGSWVRAQGAHVTRR